MTLIYFFLALLASIPFFIGHDAFVSGFIVLGIWMVINKFEFNPIRTLFYCIFACMVCLSFMLSPTHEELEILSLISPLIIPLAFLLSDSKLPDKPIFTGIITGSVFMSLLLLFFALKHGLFSNLIYTLVKNRSWGEEYIPFYGNGLALVMSFCGMLIYFYRSKILGTLILLFALLTTSRIPILSISLIFIYEIVMAKTPVKIVLFVVFLVSSIFIISVWDTRLVQLGERIAKTSDREEIYSIGFKVLNDYPLLGVGPIHIGNKFDHLHNSYLDVSARHGILSLIPYLLIIFFRPYVKMSLKDFVILIFIISVALFQIAFRHLNFAILISFWFIIRNTYAINRCS